LTRGVTGRILRPVQAVAEDVKGLRLAARIRWARNQAGLSQERFAELVGTSRRHVMRWEGGPAHRPGHEYMARIAAVTGQPESLFTDEEEEEG